MTCKPHFLKWNPAKLSQIPHHLGQNSVTMVKVVEHFTGYLNPLSPNSGENEISLYITTTYSNIQVKRIKEVITKDKMS